MTGFRHPTLGTAIDRSKPLVFHFDGQRVEGFEGDSIASALLASGCRIVGRSFKYHRPRGLYGFSSEEPNGLVDVSLEGKFTPNLRATLVKAQDGMVVRSVNTAPNARRDRFRHIDLFNRFMPTGFYYKTFMIFGWMRWEPMIRNMAGLGVLDPNHSPPANHPSSNDACEILVIGAGPAGLAAANTAAASGKQVWLVEDADRLGGSLRWRGGRIGSEDWTEFATRTHALVVNNGGKVLLNATVWGAFDQKMFAVWERSGQGPDKHRRIRAEEVILAAGAIERPMWFADNDKPGVMSLEAAYHYLSCTGALPGRDLLIYTANDLAYPAAKAFQQAGAKVTVVDQRHETPTIEGLRMVAGARVTAALGRNAVWGAVVDREYMSTDAILVSGGFTPSVHLWCQSGGKLVWHEDRDMHVPKVGTADMKVVGAANGTLCLANVVREGKLAAGDKNAGLKRRAAKEPGLAPVRPDPNLRGRQWIDLQNDVTLKDVALAAREGFTSVEHLKRYTTLGMATDQGRTSNFAGLAAMSAITGKPIVETGTTTYRPPFQPVPLAVIGGRRRGDLFNPLKRLVLEQEHRQAGARFREYGGWLRPSVYGSGDEITLAQEEALAARTSVGVFDASPLGKLEVSGPRAGELLDFTGYMRMSTLKPGRARYGFMLSETGIVYDDGVVLRPAEDRFIVSASSSHVEGVRFKLEDGRQDRLGSRGVAIHDVTSAWVTLTVTGPNSARMISDAGLSLPSLPHMGVAEIRMDGGPLRVARISFTGDKSFELSVPVAQARKLRDRLVRVMPAHDGRWIGLEAVMILRAEKGYILIGKDTDGLTMPHDLGWTGPREKRRDEYIGKRSLFTRQGNSKLRKQLVGFETEDDEPLETGSHLIPLVGRPRSLGFVTSSYFSPVLNRPIALGLLEQGFERRYLPVGAYNNGKVREVKVVEPCAFDPQGARLDV